VLTVSSRMVNSRRRSRGLGKRRCSKRGRRHPCRPKCSSVAVGLEVNRSHQIDLVQIVGLAGLRCRVNLAGTQTWPTETGAGDAVALHHSIDRPQAQLRSDVQGLKFGQNGTGPDQVVAGSGPSLGFEMATNRQNGAFQFGRDACGDLVLAPCQVLESFGAELEETTPPFVQPGFGTAKGLANVSGKAAAKAEGDRSLRSPEIVVHGNLQRAAAGGCL
jgi:hypothetical protein